MFGMFFSYCKTIFWKKQSISNWVEKLSSALEDPGKHLFHKVIWIIFLKHSQYQKKSWAKYISKRFEKYNTISGQKTKTKKIHVKETTFCFSNQPTYPCSHAHHKLPPLVPLPQLRFPTRGAISVVTSPSGVSSSGWLGEVDAVSVQPVLQQGNKPSSHDHGSVEDGYVSIFRLLSLSR